MVEDSGKNEPQVQLKLVGDERELGAHTEPDQEAAAERALLRRRMGKILTRQEEQILIMVYGLSAGEDHELRFDQKERVREIEARALEHATAQKAAQSILTPVTD